MSVYSELLDLLTPAPQWIAPCLLGRLTSLSPLTIRVGETAVTEGIFKPKGLRFRPEDVGCELALLPCEGGILILFATEGTT